MIDINIELYTPHPHQIPVHDACLDKNTFFIIIVSGRQSGKSLLLINQALSWLINEKDILVYWVSPTATQSLKIYKSIINAMYESGIILSNKGMVGDTEIVFKNNNTIKFRSAAQEDSLRGETVDYMIIDEGAFIKQSVYDTILLPMLNVSGKKCLISSTPKGKNWLYFMYLRGLKGDLKYKSFKFTSYDNPYSNRDVIELAKKSIPDILFKQEYLAEFIDSASIFENIDELSVIKFQEEPSKNDSYWAGIDIGMRNDYTVITIMNQKCEVVYYDRFTDIQSPQLKDRLNKTLTKWKPKKTYLELNNQGQPIYDDLKLIYKVPNLIGFDTTSVSKPEIINNLINAFSSKKLKIIAENYYKEELRAYTLSFSSTGKPKFGAPSGFHDDCVMSLALTWECICKHRYSGEYVFA